MDLEACEAIFAQKLACGEPPVRRRAMIKLRRWLKKGDGKELSLEDMRRLAKGLHYALWMQDKMLNQEELADQMVDLVSSMNNETQRVLFVRAMFDVLAREWSLIDRWRMDKFLMLMRKLLRMVFQRLRALNWTVEAVDGYFAVFKETVMSPDKSFTEGLKFHFASVYLDELDAVGDVPAVLVIDMLRPFAQLLGMSLITNYLFNTVLEEVFVTILHHHSEQLMDNDGDEGEDEEESKPVDSSLQFDYSAIGQMLFHIAKQPAMRSDRRKRLYAIVKKFNLASKNVDVFASTSDDDDFGGKNRASISNRQLHNAAQRLIKANRSVRKQKKRLGPKKEKKKKKEKEKKKGRER